MTTVTALCGHEVTPPAWPVCQWQDWLCPACSIATTATVAHGLSVRLREQRDLIRQLSERIATCSELLGKAAERHDNAEAIRAEVASVLEVLDGLAFSWDSEAVFQRSFRRCRDRLRKITEVKRGE